MVNYNRAIHAFEKELPSRVITRTEDLKKAMENTLGVERKIHAILYPKTTKEVQKIVKIANLYRTPLYPVSQGQNLGYGSKAPIFDNQILVDLSLMNKIRELNEVEGYVIVEPGVTQKQLYEFLKEVNASFIADVTGAPSNASIIGNSLEGGFGHTPKGNRRKILADLEVILGNGTLLKTGIFPNIGPDLSQLFVQSNFGIITAMRISLLPKLEYFESFLISTEYEKFEELIDGIRKLRQQGTLTSLVHIGNAFRYLMTTGKVPSGFENKLLSAEESKKILSNILGINFGDWVAIGALYGSRKEVGARKKEVKRNLGSKGQLYFFNDQKLAQLERGSFFMKMWGKNTAHFVTGYKILHNLMQGIPTDDPLQNALWRIEKREELGLLWLSPTTTASGVKVKTIVQIAEPLFQKYQFEMPLTITLVEPERVVGVLNITFNKNNEEQKNRAHQLYHELSQNLKQQGIFPYRESIMGMQKIVYGDPGKKEVLRMLKKTLDPHNIISPGRYGIS